MEKRFWLFSTPTCVNCPAVKQTINSDEELKSAVEFRDALEHKDWCISKGIRTVPTLWDTEEEKAYFVGMYSAEELANVIKGDNNG